MVPKISILIPVFNREQYIEECIRSALMQTYDRIEVIVVDNASTDQTWEIVQGLAKVDHRIRAYRNNSNIGPVRNWEKCAGYATGTYSKILWSDDLLVPEFLEKCASFLSDPSVGFVYTSVSVFSNINDRRKNSVYSIGPTGKYDSKCFVEGLLLGGDYPASPCCALFRTIDLKNNILSEIPNKISSDFSQHAIGSDMLLFLLTAHKYIKFAYIDEDLTFFRVHAESISAFSSSSKLVFMYDIVKAYFVTVCDMPIKIRKRLNVRLRLDLMRYPGNDFGLQHVNDFYPSETKVEYDILYFSQLFLIKVKSLVKSFFVRLQHNK